MSCGRREGITQPSNYTEDELILGEINGNNEMIVYKFEGDIKVVEDMEKV